MKLETNKLFNGDCLEVMRQIPDFSVDAVICDPPYEVLHKNNPNAAWDRLLPFDKLWEQYLRIAKPTAPIILFAQGMFTAQLMTSMPKLWKYNLIWEKDRCTGFLNANRMPMRNHEDICVFYREQPTYNPQMTYASAKHESKARKRKRTKAMHENDNENDNDNYNDNDNDNENNTTTKQQNNSTTKEQNNKTTKQPIKKVGSTYDYAHINRVAPTADPNMRFPRSVLQFAKEHSKIVTHPTQKPLALLRYLIRTYTNAGDLILDNCCGSGSTLIAAIKEGRNYIGIEKDPQYFQQAQAWIQRETMEYSLKLET